MTNDPSSGEQHSTPQAPSGADDAASPSSGRQNLVETPSFVRKIRKKLKSHPVTDQAYRLTVGVIGSLVVMIGLLLLVFPGPGWLIVIVGLLILATEFDKAERLLHFVRKHVEAWTDWIKRQSLGIRMLVTALTALGACVLLYVTALLTGIPAWIPEPLVPDLPGLSRAG